LQNRLHFGQAQGTPLTEEPLRDAFDWAATSEAARATIAGTFPSSHDVAQCQTLLEACKAVSDLDIIPAEISEEQFDGKIKSWSETTSTSPSGRHLGRYKALFAASQYDKQDQDFEYTTFLRKQQAIKALTLSIINWCIRNGHVLERWKTIINVMIFKDSGDYRIHRLRVIHIYEADFNLTLAVKWRQLLHHADSNGLLNPGQFGGRPGCEAQFLAFLEELKFDIAYLSRRTLLTFDNDAMSCYDRIILALASLINLKYGQHRQVVVVHATTLEQTKYLLRMGMKLSAIEYSHSIRFPIHGSGQGSGNSPCIWLFISSTMFDIHASQAHGATFTSPDGTETIKLTMVGFVDDANSSTNNFQAQTQKSLDELCEMKQHDAQVWHDILNAGSQRLEVPKCSFHALYFRHLSNGTPMVEKAALKDRITILDADGNTVPIPAYAANRAHKTLGHWKCPGDPKQATQLKKLTEKARETSILLGTSPVDRTGATLAYHGAMVPSVKYPLPQSFFSQKALDKAQSTVMSTIIAKCGYNRKTSHAILYAPTAFAGGGFIHWYTLQGEGQISLFLKHWRSDTLISQTLRINAAWNQWQSRFSEPILESTDLPAPHLESRWYKSMRQFLHYWIGQGPESLHDFHIMDYAISSGLFDDEQIKIANYHRLYLNVTSVSELFDASGTHMLPHMFECIRPPWFNPSTVITLQRRPSGFQRRTVWKRLCREWCTHDLTIAASLTLGPRTVPGNVLRLRRETYWEVSVSYDSNQSKPGSRLLTASPSPSSFPESSFI
jgi:hypothetical protein